MNKRMFLKAGAGLALAAGLTAAVTASAEIRVAASTTNMAMLASEVGGDHVEVSTLAPPDRDAHYLEARPSMIAAIRNADLVMSVGAELEAGWIPAAINAANNPSVQPGRTGYFEAAAQVNLIGQEEADRGRGDVHPRGNPHVYMDPVRMGQIAGALAERLADIDATHEETFRENARAFQDQVEARLDDWQDAAADAPGAVLYHEDGDYLMERLDVRIHGFLEPVPGVPPTGRHLRELVRKLGGRDGVVIHLSFQPGDGAQFLSRELGWNVYALENNVPLDGNASDYFALIDTWVDAVAD